MAETDTYKAAEIEMQIRGPICWFCTNKRYCLNIYDQLKWGNTFSIQNIKSNNKPQISLGKASAESVVVEIATLTKNIKI